MYEILNEPVEIRLGKAKNKKTDPDLLEILSCDSFWFVRNYVATNPSTNHATLIKLLQDDDFRVRFEADKNLKNRQLSNRITDAEQRKSVLNPDEKTSEYSISDKIK